VSSVGAEGWTLEDDWDSVGCAHEGAAWLEGQEEAPWDPLCTLLEVALAGLAEVLHHHVPGVGGELTRHHSHDGDAQAVPEVGGADDWGLEVFCGGLDHVVLHHVKILKDVLGNRNTY